MPSPPIARPLPPATTEGLGDASQVGGAGPMVGRRPLVAFAWMSAASLLFALMSVVSRLAAVDGVPWTEMAVARALMGVVVALGVALLRRAPLVVHDRRLAWARSLFGSAAMVCTFYTLGSRNIALGDAVTLGATTAIWIALLSPWLLRERSGRLVWLATFVAFGGVALVVGPRFEIHGHVAFVATLGSVFSAFAMIMLRKMGAGSRGRVESPEAIVVHFSLVASGVTLALALPSLRAPGLRDGVYLAAAGVTGGLAQLAMTRAYALEQAAKVGTVGYLGVVASHIGGAVVLGEWPGIAQVAGTALVIGAGVAITWASLRHGSYAPAACPGPSARSPSTPGEETRPV